MLAAAGVPPRGIIVRAVSPRRSAPVRDHPADLSARSRPWQAPAASGRKISALRSRTGAISTTSRTGISAAPLSATWRRWSTIRPTSCSRAPKRRPYTARRTDGFEKYRKGTTDRDRSIPKPTRPNSAIQANDQLRSPERRRRSRRHSAGGRRSYRAGAARFGAGVLRDGGNRGGRASGRRGSPAGQGPSQDPDGRHGRRRRGLSLGADAERHHSRNRRAQRHPGRARPACHRVRRRHARRRDRPRQRRHAVSRAGARAASAIT